MVQWKSFLKPNLARFGAPIFACTLAILAPSLAHAGDDKLTSATGVYNQFCQHCHGPAMVNPGTGSYDLRKFPVDDKARFFNSVQHGKGDMPAWGDILTPDELDLLWYYTATRAGKQPFPEEPASGDADTADTEKKSP